VLKKVVSEIMLMLLLTGMLRLAYDIQRAKASGINYIEANDLLNAPWGDWKHYHNYTEIVDTLIFLNETYPNHADVFTIGKSWQNRSIYCIRLTNESNTRPKPQVFFVGYHHAREPITAELALYFAVDAVTKFGTNVTITQMLNSSEIYVVPALNVDGFDLFKVNDWQRKNARPIDEDHDGLVNEDPPEDENHDGFIEQLYNLTNGRFIRWEGVDNDGDGQNGEDWVGGVDLNRNYDYQWQSGSSDLGSEIYKGPAPFSEPETQAIRNLVLSHNFTYAISFHSGAELILYPWGWTRTHPPDAVKFIQIAQNLSSITGGTTYEQSSDLYISYGTWDDWMYGIKHVFALTCEIFSNDTFEVVKPGPYNNTEWEGGIRYMFNPFPSGIESTLLRWFPVFTYVTNRAITEAYVIHDVAITGINTKKIVGQGFITRINITATNHGYSTETFNVTLYANIIPLASQDVTVTSKKSKTITFAWNTTNYVLGNYTIKAIADIVEGEIDIANNTLIDGGLLVTKVGDFGGDTPPQFFKCDGNIDGKDLSLFLQCYKGTAPPEAEYLGDLGSGVPPQFYKSDGKVDGKDLALFLECFKGLGPYN
jgi:hypothetical protein